MQNVMLVLTGRDIFSISLELESEGYYSGYAIDYLMVYESDLVACLGERLKEDCYQFDVIHHYLVD